jgi:predicted DNA-binding transcriptional regulator AlpA
LRLTTAASDHPAAIEHVPKLLIGIGGLSQMLDWSERTTRRKYSAGLLPRPIKISGSIRWNVEEIRRWVNAGCPTRAAWEATKEK